MKSPEFNTSPESNIPTWEELLVGVLARKLLPPSEPPPEGMIELDRRYFRTASGDALTVTYVRFEDDDAGTWGLGITPHGESPSKGYSLGIFPYEGQLRLIPDGSELPLASSAAEHLLQQVVTAVPLEDPPH